MSQLANFSQLFLQSQINLRFKELPRFYSFIAQKNYFFQLVDEEQFETIPKQSEQKQLPEKNLILCKGCHYPITSLNQKIQVNGTHHHIFCNPTGFVFEMGCFASANGCINYGAPTLEYTWFNGFAWCYALCSHCHLHLGWFYQSPSDRFYGLILNQLLEPSY